MAQTTINTTQDMVVIDTISDGVIRTKDGRFLSIVEISPINFAYKNEEEKTAIIEDFAGWFKVSPVHIQFKMVSEPADLTAYIEKLDKEYANETNKACKELQNDYRKLVLETGVYRGVKRRFFVILESSVNSNNKDSYNAAITELGKARQTVINFFSKCGNSIIKHKNEDLFLLDIFYLLYNRSATETLYERILRIMNKRQEYGIDNVDNVTLADMLAPEKIRVEADYLIVGRKFYRFLYLPAKDGYSTKVVGSWLQGLLSLWDGVDVDLFFDKQPKTKIRDKVGQQIRVAKSKAKDAEDTNDDFDSLTDAIASGYYIREGMNKGEDFWYMSTLITVSADSLDILNERCREISEMMSGADFGVRSCKYHMMDAFLSSLPVCSLNNAIKKRAKRNVLTSGAASTYPFCSLELMDNDGIMLGLTEGSQSLCVLDLFDSKKYSNANMTVLGMSGAGKTFTIQTMALRMRLKGIQTFILAPLKGHEYKRACDAVDGSYINMAASCINIMEIRPFDTSANALIDGAVSDESLLFQKIQNLHIFFKLIIPNLDYMGQEQIDSAIMEAYKRKGITRDNVSLIDPNKPSIHGLPQYKQMPILKDVYDILLEKPATQHLAQMMRRYVDGSLSTFNGQTDVDLNNKYIVVDISRFTEELQPVAMFVALDYIYDKIKEDRTAKKAVIVDETWKLIGSKSNALAANFVLEIFKIIRGYGGSAIAATQDINDFFALDGGKYGKGIISNAKTKIILHLESQEADTVKDVFNLTNIERNNITHFDRGHGMLITNNNNVGVNFIASEHEKNLITTDPAELRKISEELRKQEQERSLKK